MKYRNRFRLSRLTKFVKNSIITYMKGNVPTYILNDVKDRLDNGEKEITIHMVLDRYNSSIVGYLNEYHGKKNHGWNLDFLHKAYYFVCDILYRKLNSYSDIEIDFLDFSDTDKRIVIKIIE